MSKQFAIRLGTLLALFTAFLGLTTTAHAAPQSQQHRFDYVVPASDPAAGAVGIRTADGQIEMAALSSASADDVTVQGTHKFDRATTQRIYNVALALGPAGVTVLCGAIAPGPVKVICPLFGAVVAAYMLNNPPRGRCLQISWKFVPPTINARYVTC